MNRKMQQSVVAHLADIGVFSAEQAREWEQIIQSDNGDTAKRLVESGAIPEAQFANALSHLLQLDIVTPAQYPKQVLDGTQSLAAFFHRHEVLPLEQDANTLKLAMTNPADEFVLKVLRTKLGLNVKPFIGQRSDLLSALHHLYPDQVTRTQDSGSTVSLVSSDNNEPVSGLIREIHRLIQQGISRGASDIHFEPNRGEFRSRFRINGLLQDARSFALNNAAQVVARLKIMASLDVTNRRQPQDGRFKFQADGRAIDVRVSTLPLHEGESVVIRLLEASFSERTLQQLGFHQTIAESLEAAINTQQGLILVTGPTGSGKTTTLYSLMHYMNKPETKLISIENPVELNIGGISQIQIDEKHGITFPNALRSVLRQDPDVIMVGEIRDSETAKLAAQAALTGHLVLSTLHTASAISAIARLQSLGLPDYLISTTLKSVVAQRLVRTLCDTCEVTPNADCPHCQGDRYAGRTVIAELLSFSDNAEQRDLSDASLSRHLVGGQTLAKSASELVKHRVSDQREVLRVLGQLGA